ncbi:hypothetical protein F4778DRAFT_779374 [Xylariomycetidae sp. FL2044]|nr:hypothetical protein F4778DRAFT_779374 [Xylariomycetidae sp. FL2044]
MKPAAVLVSLISAAVAGIVIIPTVHRDSSGPCWHITDLGAGKSVVDGSTWVDVTVELPTGQSIECAHARSGDPGPYFLPNVTGARCYGDGWTFEFYADGEGQDFWHIPTSATLNIHHRSSYNLTETATIELPGAGFVHQVGKNPQWNSDSASGVPEYNDGMAWTGQGNFWIPGSGDGSDGCNF